MAALGAVKAGTYASCSAPSSLRPFDALAVGALRGDEVADGVTAELLLRGDRQLPGDCGLGDDRERLDGGDVGALDERGPLFAGGEVDGGKRFHQRRQRLHRGTDDDLLAVRHARFDAARTIRPPAA